MTQITIHETEGGREEAGHQQYDGRRHQTHPGPMDPTRREGTHRGRYVPIGFSNGVLDAQDAVSYKRNCFPPVLVGRGQLIHECDTTVKRF